MTGDYDPWDSLCAHREPILQVSFRVGFQVCPQLYPQLYPSVCLEQVWSENANRGGHHEVDAKLPRRWETLFPERCDSTIAWSANRRD